MKLFEEELFETDRSKIDSPSFKRLTFFTLNAGGNEFCSFLC